MLPVLINRKAKPPIKKITSNQIIEEIVPLLVLSAGASAPLAPPSVPKPGNQVNGRQNSRTFGLLC